MKILIVKYLPSGNDSYTAELLDFFKSRIKKFYTIEELDLLENIPPVHNLVSMKAYKERNFGGKELNDEQKKAIEPMDKLSLQFKNADLIVFAYPMHNFSIPGIVKTYLDAVIQKSILFKSENNESKGLMGKSKFINIYTSKGAYDREYGFLDNAKVVMKIELDFMGFIDYEFVHASTGNDVTRKVHVANAQKMLEGIIKKWNL